MIKDETGVDGLEYTGLCGEMFKTPYGAGIGYLRDEVDVEEDVTEQPIEQPEENQTMVNVLEPNIIEIPTLKGGTLNLLVHAKKDGTIYDTRTGKEVCYTIKGNTLMAVVFTEQENETHVAVKNMVMWKYAPAYFKATGIKHENGDINDCSIGNLKQEDTDFGYIKGEEKLTVEQIKNLTSNLKGYIVNGFELGEGYHATLNGVIYDKVRGIALPRNSKDKNNKQLIVCLGVYKGKQLRAAVVKLVAYRGIKGFKQSMMIKHSDCNYNDCSVWNLELYSNNKSKEPLTLTETGNPDKPLRIVLDGGVPKDTSSEVCNMVTEPDVPNVLERPKGEIIDFGNGTLECKDIAEPIIEQHVKPTPPIQQPHQEDNMNNVQPTNKTDWSKFTEEDLERVLTVKRKQRELEEKQERERLELEEWMATQLADI